MLRVLIAGGSGLLGSALTIYLKTKGYEVYSTGYSSDNVIKVDFTCPKQVNLILSRYTPDYIINLVALTNVDQCEIEPQKAYLLNVKVIENIVRWQQSNNHKAKLIQLSTDMLYDSSDRNTVAQENDICIRNLYTMSKYAGELSALSTESIILRTNFFGHSLVNNRDSFSDWLIKSFAAKQSLTLFTDVYFSPLSIDSVVRNIGLVMDKFTAGVFNLGSHGGLSKAEFALQLASTLKINIEFAQYQLKEEVYLKAYRPNNMLMDSSAFEQTFGVKLPCLSEEIKQVGYYELQQRNQD